MSGIQELLSVKLAEPGNADAASAATNYLMIEKQIYHLQSCLAKVEAMITTIAQQSTFVCELEDPCQSSMDMQYELATLKAIREDRL